MDTDTVNYDDLIDMSDMREIKYTPVSGIECYALVDNLPIVSENRVEKLKKVLRLKLGAYGTIPENGIVMPYDEERDATRGFAFIEYSNSEEVMNASISGNGSKLDAKTVLRILPFMQVDSFLAMSDVYEEPTSADGGDFGHLRSWLTDKKARDQFVIIIRDIVYIYWNNKNGPPDLVCSRRNWTGYYVTWSPLGTYLTTFHDLGVALWGGPEWKQVCKLEHNSARLVDYSPKENYIVTWSQYPMSRLQSDNHNLVIWEISSGRQLRTFQITASPSNNDNIRSGLNIKVDWPVMQWSHDDKYVARLHKETIYIYELPSAQCITGKGLKIPRIKSFSWSPGENIISYWTSELDNIPAKVNLISVPSMEIIRSKNLFSVSNAQLYWQSAGDYLLVLVEGFKSKKQTVTSVEVFRMREKDVPVDRVEIGLNVVVSSVHVEPEGSRFILLVNDMEAVNCNVYKIVTNDDTNEEQTQSKKKKKATVHNAEVNANVESIALLKAIPAREINHISWAPRGGRCVLAGIKEGKSGDIRFWDMNELILLGSGEHRSCTSVEWDPTGRYLVSFISSWHSPMDTGFKLWNFTGKLVATQLLDEFAQFLWRPRPPFLFPKDVGVKVNKKLKEYSKTFTKEDAEAHKAIYERIRKEHQSLLKKWNEYCAKCKEEYNASKDERDKLWGMDIDEFKSDKSGKIEYTVIEVTEQQISKNEAAA